MKQNIHRVRRSAAVALLALVFAGYGIFTELQTSNDSPSQDQKITHATQQDDSSASHALETLAVKGRAPKTGYKRAEFGNGWQKNGDCTTREIILARDLDHPEVRECKVFSGTLKDPYTGKVLSFVRGPQTSNLIQIDHVVALSDAWQKGAQNLDARTREELANDPLELIAVDGSANQKKSDGDAAT